MSQCPCGSGQTYDACCGPLIEGKARAETAEALMRSRYTAFTMAAMDYIHDTLSPEGRKDYDPKGTESWARNSDWLGLEIRDTQKGGPEDEEGVVEFCAHFRHKGETHAHVERASFRRDEDGAWIYVDGESPKPEQRVTGPKVGRNDPCPCGSGKKYKKCCGG